MRVRLLLVGLLGVVGLVACEENGSAPPTGDGGAVAIEAGSSSSSSGGGSGTNVPAPGSGGEFCDRTLGVVVRALEGCCTAQDKETADYAFTHDLAERLLPVCSETLEASIARTRVVENAANRDACYAAYAATYAPGKCANITQTYADPAGDACRLAFAGVGAAGAPCRGNHECEDGLTCVGYTGTTDGECKTPPALGEACGPARTDAGAGGGGGGGAASLEFGSHPDCAAGASCDSLERKCVPAEPEAPKSDENGPCTESDGCKPQLYCEGGTTCRPKKAAGGTCTGGLVVTECIGRCDAAVGQPGTCVSFCGSP